VNWNGWRDTTECVASLLDASPRPAAVVVVDNDSGDGSVAALAAWANERSIEHRVLDDRVWQDAVDSCWLTIITSSQNRGFAGGNNLALAYLANHERLSHLLLLNNDATVAPDYFAEISAAVGRRPDAGILTGTIYEAGDRSRVWYAGGVAKPLRGLLLHTRSLPGAPDPVETDFVSGCSMLISRRVLTTIGLLPECYFPGYWEDGEYSARARANGFPLVYAPRAVAYHKVGASFGQPEVRPGVAYLHNRNRVFFIRRNLRGWLRLAALAYMGVTKPGRAVVEVLKGRPRIGWAILRGTVVGFVSAQARR
jgi:GT2 family glycosyltransferase